MLGDIVPTVEYVRWVLCAEQWYEAITYLFVLTQSASVGFSYTAAG